MKFPKSIEVQSNRGWDINFKENIYGQIQPDRAWTKFLGGGLTSSEFGFRQSKVDKCMLYQGKSLYILYTDYYILTGPYEE